MTLSILLFGLFAVSTVVVVLLVWRAPLPEDL